MQALKKHDKLLSPPERRSSADLLEPASGTAHGAAAPLSGVLPELKGCVSFVEPAELLSLKDRLERVYAGVFCGAAQEVGGS